MNFDLTIALWENGAVQEGHLFDIDGVLTVETIDALLVNDNFRRCLIVPAADKE